MLQLLNITPAEKKSWEIYIRDIHHRVQQHVCACQNDEFYQIHVVLSAMMNKGEHAKTVREELILTSYIIQHLSERYSLEQIP